METCSTNCSVRCGRSPLVSPTLRAGLFDDDLVARLVRDASDEFRTRHQGGPAGAAGRPQPGRC